MTDEMKPLRMRLAMLTGMIQMKKDLENDILEMRGQIEQGQPINGNVRSSLQTRIDQKLLPAVPSSAPTDIEDAIEIKKRGRPKGISVPKGEMTPAMRRRSKQMKRLWAEARARGENNPFKPTKAASVVTATVTKKSKNITTKGSGRRPLPPTIGFKTRAEFIYEYARDHGGILDVKDAKQAAAKNKLRQKLAINSGLSVATAEMKRKGLVIHAKETGKYTMTPLAHQIYKQERERQQQ